MLCLGIMGVPIADTLAASVPISLWLNVTDCLVFCSDLLSVFQQKAEEPSKVPDGYFLIVYSGK